MAMVMFLQSDSDSESEGEFDGFNFEDVRVASEKAKKKRNEVLYARLCDSDLSSGEDSDGDDITRLQLEVIGDDVE